MPLIANIVANGKPTRPNPNTAIEISFFLILSIKDSNNGMCQKIVLLNICNLIKNMVFGQDIIDLFKPKIFNCL